MKFLKKNITSICITAFLGLLILLRLPYIPRHFCIPDEGEIAYEALMLLEGKVTYRDTGTHKPMGAFFIFAFIYTFFGKSMIFINILTLILIWIMCILVYKIGTHVDGTQLGILSGFAFCFLSSNRLIGTTCPNYTTYMIFPLTVSIYTLILALESRSMKYFLTTGFFFGLGVLTKQSALAHAGIFFILLIFLRGKQHISIPIIVKYSVFLCIGFCLAVIPFIGFFIAKKSDPFYLLIPFNMEERVEFSTSMGFFNYVKNMVFQTSTILIENLIFFALTLSSLVYMVMNFRKLKISEFLLIIWLLFSFIGVCLGGRFFSHYYVQLIPSMAVLSGYSLSAIIRCIDKLSTFALLSILILILLGSFVSIIYNLRDFVKHETQAYEKVAEYIKINTKEGDRIYVWGFCPEIYFLSGRFANTKYYHYWLLVGTSLQMEGPIFAKFRIVRNKHTNVFLQEMLENKPKYFILAKVFDFDPELSDLPEIKKMVETNYTLEKKIDNILIYRIKK